MRSRWRAPGARSDRLGSHRLRVGYVLTLGSSPPRLSAGSVCFPTCFVSHWAASSWPSSGAAHRLSSACSSTSFPSTSLALAREISFGQRHSGHFACITSRKNAQIPRSGAAPLEVTSRTSMLSSELCSAWDRIPRPAGGLLAACAGGRGPSAAAPGENPVSQPVLWVGSFDSRRLFWYRCSRPSR